MAHDHPHSHHHGREHGELHHAVAERPTVSLLRLSAVQRLAGVALVLGVLWLMVLGVIG
jgi:hypothetical protein